MPHLFDIILLAVLPLLLMASAFFSGSETALFSLSGADRLRLHRSDSLAGRTVLSLLSETRELLITLLMSNMTVNVLYFVVSTVVLIRLQREYQAPTLLVSALSIAPLLMVVLLGEVLPKLTAARMPAKFAQVAAVPLMAVHRGLGPIRWITSAVIITPLARLIAPPQRSVGLAPADLENLLSLSAARGVIDPHEEDLLHGVLGLSSAKVGTIMTPRVDIRFHDVTASIEDLVSLIRETRLSHIPICERDLDHVIGFVRSKQVLLRNVSTLKQLREIMTTARFVPQQQRIEHLLRHFRKTQTTFAIVVDEFGGTAGLVTLEDAVEAMVGEIAGPYEGAGDFGVEKVSPNLWRTRGDLPVEEWIEAFRLDNESHADPGVCTLGGLVMTRLGHLPRVGDRVTLRNIELEVESMRGRRIGNLLLRVLPLPEAPHTMSAASREGA